MYLLDFDYLHFLFGWDVIRRETTDWGNIFHFYPQFTSCGSRWWRWWRGNRAEWMVFILWVWFCTLGEDAHPHTQSMILMAIVESIKQERPSILRVPCHVKHDAFLSYTTTRTKFVFFFIVKLRHFSWISLLISPSAPSIILPQECFQHRNSFREKILLIFIFKYYYHMKTMNEKINLNWLNEWLIFEIKPERWRVSSLSTFEYKGFM